MPISDKSVPVDAPAAAVAPNGGIVEIDDPATKRILQPHLVGFLMGSTGFFASIIRNMDKVCTRSVPTMAVAFRRDLDRFILYWNPDWVKKIADEGNKRLDGLGDTWMHNILCHEVLHIALKHCTVRARDPHSIWNISTDLSINSMICGADKSKDGFSNLPDGALIPGKRLLKPDGSRYVRGQDSDFACDMAQALEELPPGNLSEIYFEALMDAFRDEIEKQKEKQKQRGEGQGGEGQQQDGDSEPQDGDGSGEPQDGGGAGGIETLDDHKMWKQTGADPNKLATDDDREYVEQRVRDLMRRAVTHAEQSSNGWGCVPLTVRASIKCWLQGEIDWRKVLAMWVNGRIRGEQHSTIRRINRRFPMVHPGSKRNHRPLLLIAKDQSGSVSDEAVALFYGECAALSKNVDFDQVSFDTECSEVERWYRGSLPEATRERSGGTDFNAVTRLMEHPDNRGRWDGLLMLTDGECSKPEPSLVPRIWIICPGHKLLFQPDEGELIINLDGERRDDAGVLG